MSAVSPVCSAPMSLSRSWSGITVTHGAALSLTPSMFSSPSSSLLTSTNFSLPKFALFASRFSFCLLIFPLKLPTFMLYSCTLLFFPLQNMLLVLVSLPLLFTVTWLITVWSPSFYPPPFLMLSTTANAVSSQISNTSLKVRSASLHFWAVADEWHIIHRTLTVLPCIQKWKQGQQLPFNHLLAISWNILHRCVNYRQRSWHNSLISIGDAVHTASNPWHSRQQETIYFLITLNPKQYVSCIHKLNSFNHKKHGNKICLFIPSGIRVSKNNKPLSEGVAVLVFIFEYWLI